MTHNDVADGQAPAGDGRGSRWNVHKAERRQHIIACAVAEIQNNGADVTVASIAAHAGLTRAAVYRMFGSPEQLYDDIRRAIALRFLVRFSAAFGGQTSVVDTMARAIHQYVELAITEPGLYRFVGGAGSQPAKYVVDSMRRESAAYMENEIRSYCAMHDLDQPHHVEQLSYGLAVLIDSTVARWTRTASVARQSRTDLEALLTRWCDVLIQSEIGGSTSMRTVAT